MTFTGALIGGEGLERPAHVGPHRALLVRDRLLRRRRHGGEGCRGRRGHSQPRGREREEGAVGEGGGSAGQVEEAHHQRGHCIFYHPRLVVPPCPTLTARPSLLSAGASAAGFPETN